MNRFPSSVTMYMDGNNQMRIWSSSEPSEKSMRNKCVACVRLCVVMLLGHLLKN